MVESIDIASLLPAYHSALDRLRSFPDLTTGAVDELRKNFPELDPQRSSFVLSLAEGRLNAERLGKSTDPEVHLLFTRQTAQQSTHPVLAKHHASRFGLCKSVLELCTGSGLDTLALSKVVRAVTTIEIDSAIQTLAMFNFRQSSCRNITGILSGAESFLADNSVEEFDGIWADPSRRESHDGKRAINEDDYLPEIATIKDVCGEIISGIKMSPVTNTQPGDGWTREWVGVGRELREQVLWNNTAVADGTATVFSADYKKIETWEPTIFATTPICHRNLDSLVGWSLIEPHPAVIRGGFLSNFFLGHEIQFLDEHIAYGVTSRKLSDSLLAGSFTILESFTYTERRLQDRITSLKWNSSTIIKKRGIKETANETFKKLKWEKEGKPGVVILTRIGDSRHCFLAERD